MDEEQRNEKFGMDNDYEGGQWIDGEFFYTKKKARRAQTKEEQLYGVWGSSGEEEADEAGGFGRRKKQRREGGRTDYKAPVGFVSAGRVGGDAEAANDAPAAAPERGGLGSGMAGLGFTKGGVQKPEDEPPGPRGAEVSAPLSAQAAEASRDDDEPAVLPTDFGRRIRQAAAEEAERREAERRVAEARGGHGEFRGVGEFEKHTKGIGAKLLAKMGYKPGQGLGRAKQGIASAIQVKMRPKGMGMGYNDFQEAGQLNKAAEEGADAGGGVGEAVTVIDMRGPQGPKVLKNLEGLSKDADDLDTPAAPRGFLPEVRHNLRLLVDLAEADLSKFSGQLRRAKDTALVLGREKDRLRGELQDAEESADAHRALAGQCRAVESVAKALARTAVSAAGADGGDASGAAVRALDALADAYERMLRGFPAEYATYGMGRAAAGRARPHLRALMSGWAPLSDPRRGVEVWRRWRAIVDPGSGEAGPLTRGGGVRDPWAALLAEAVLPHVRHAFTTLWSPKDPEPALQLLEAWQGVMPPSGTRHVIDALIRPRLRRELEAWDPRGDPVPLHAWVHPWLPHLGSDMEEFYPGIRHKFSTVLAEWHPSDGSALAVLAPWRAPFGERGWGSLMQRSVLPKLAEALRALHVNPAAQDTAPLTWVLAWEPHVAPAALAQLLEAELFPKWHQVLDHWLRASPNFGEVTQWINGWQSLLPERLLHQEGVRRHFAAALDAMNRAHATGDPGGAPPGPRPRPRRRRRSLRRRGGRRRRRRWTRRSCRCGSWWRRSRRSTGWSFCRGRGGRREVCKCGRLGGSAWCSTASRRWCGRTCAGRGRPCR
ncbi:unnamed protein product [Pedinophyceae sp. YPF-701]|nr:unnamed protein product [Pedinophyceae sp. YPF-701]